MLIQDKMNKSNVDPKEEKLFSFFNSITLKIINNKTITPNFLSGKDLIKL
jgi:hypothetical protein